MTQTDITQTEKPVLGFHFVLLAIGEVLKVDPLVNAQTLQNFITRNDTFGGYRIPLSDCRNALLLMEQSGFIDLIPDTYGDYKWGKHYGA